MKIQTSLKAKSPFVWFKLLVVVLLVFCFTGSVQGATVFYNGSGDKIFKAGKAKIYNSDLLDGVAKKIIKKKTIRSIAIQVGCSTDDGGKDLAQARAGALKKYFSGRLAGIVITTSGNAIPSMNDFPDEILKKLPPTTVAQMKSMPSGGFVRITGTGDTKETDENEVFGEIDARIDEVEFDWERDLLKRYRKVLKTMDKLCSQTLAETIEECDLRNLKRPERDICWLKSLKAWRINELKLSEKELKVAQLGHKLASEVQSIAMEIVKHKPDVTTPEYDENVGRDFIKYHKLSMKYQGHSIKTLKYGLNYLNGFDKSTSEGRRQIREHEGAFRIRASYLFVYPLLGSIPRRTTYLDEQILLNDFVRIHLGVSPCGALSLPICLVWHGTNPDINGESLLELEYEADRQWRELGIPEIEFDFNRQAEN